MLSGRIICCTPVATTSVKLTEEAKDRLDRLQAKLVLLGYKFTKEQVLDLAIETASEAPADLIARAQGVRYPVPEGEVEAVIRSAEHWGRSSWRDIDALVYGKRKKR